MPRRAYIPLGCDQQGRHPSRAIPPAECCTELGVEPPRTGRRTSASKRVGCIAVGLVTVIALLASLAHFVARVGS